MNTHSPQQDHADGDWAYTEEAVHPDDPIANGQRWRDERDTLLEMARDLRLSARVLATAQRCYPDPTGEAAEILGEVEETIAKFDAIYPPDEHCSSVASREQDSR